MKKLLILIFLFTGVALQAVLVDLPTAEVLRSRLYAIDMDDFVKNTDLVKNLAGQRREAAGVAVLVEAALYDYDEYIKNPMVSKLMRISRPMLISSILEDYPEAIEELKGLGFFKN